MILYRPVGTGELKLIADSGYTAFPPRLPEQPIFYSVLNEKYACEIAFGWNVKYNEDHKGYVTKFEIDDDYAAAFEIHNVAHSITMNYGCLPRNSPILIGTLSEKLR